MSYIDETVFDDQMRGLLVARGGYTSEKKKEEIKRFWYIEFRDCDEHAFVQVIGRLKFAGKSGDGFPSFRDFREEYNLIIKPEDRLKGRQFCGMCHKGVIFYRDLHPESGEVHDYVADCSRCKEKSHGDLIKVNPHKLHKDRLGQYRTFEALDQDRKKLEVKRPAWLFERHPKLKDEKVYFQGLNAINDPDVEFSQIVPVESGVSDVPY